MPKKWLSRQLGIDEWVFPKWAWSGSSEQFLHCGLRKFHHSKSSVYRWYTQLDRRRFVYDTYKTMKATRNASRLSAHVYYTTAHLNPPTSWLWFVQSVRAVSVDFGKAFDHTDHNILMTMMLRFGLSDTVMCWMCDFLWHHTQRMKIDITVRLVTDQRRHAARHLPQAVDVYHSGWWNDSW